MIKSRSVLTVFLASPSDVGEERSAAEDVVTSINKTIGRILGWQIDLHKWEETKPGFGRPQEIINEKVDACDLFIGLLWERWGQPSGAYSSGFEEEFERAKARRKAGSEPDIWLFFKVVTDEKDPGPQLANVLDFRKRQMALREVLFQEVSDTADWKAKLNNWLIEHVLKLALPQMNTSRSEPSHVPILDAINDSELRTLSHKGIDEPIPAQVKGLVSSLNRLVASGNLEFDRQQANLLQEFDVARAFLLSATWMARRYSGTILGTHELNLLYKHRTRLETTFEERLHLLRTVIAMDDNVGPGWYWFRDDEPELIADRLFRLASTDSSSSVRSRALAVLTTASISIAKDDWFDLPFADESSDVRDQAYEYLVTVGDEQAVQFFELLAAAADESTRPACEASRLKILARLDPSRVLSEIMAGSHILSDSAIQDLKLDMSRVDEGVLLKALDAHSTQIRKLVVVELSGRGQLSTELAQRLTLDPLVSIRALAFESLAKAGSPIKYEELRKALKDETAGSRSAFSIALGGKSESPDEDSIILAFYRTRTTEELLRATDWFSVDGPLAYRALALDKFGEFSGTLRADISNGFERVKEESLERLVSQAPPDIGLKLRDSLLSDFRDLESFVRSRFIVSALMGLAANGEGSDAQLAQSFLESENSEIKEAAASVICKLATVNDRDILVELATELWGEVARTAARAALRVSNNQLELAREFMTSTRTELMDAAFEWLYGQDVPDVRSWLGDILQDQNETNRERAIYYASQGMTRNELQDMLTTYQESDTHYYNVVAWLDRLLYAPPLIRKRFATELERMARV